jgi:hypothetical protein
MSESRPPTRNVKLEPGYWWFCLKLWRRETVEHLRWKAAWWLPRSIALLAFVRVYSASGDSPGPEYGRAYDAFKNGAGR